MAKDTPSASGYTASALSQRKTNKSGVLSLPSAGSVLLTSVACLLVLSLMMVVSASIPFTNMHEQLNQLYFFNRHLLYIGIGLFAGFVTYKIPLRWFYDMLSLALGLILIVLLLLATLAFGDVTNGSKRWLEIGVINFQAAELVKLVMVMFAADFVVRRANEVRTGLAGITRMTILLTVVVFLLMMQPDYGSSVIVIGTILAIFFVAGAPRKQSISIVVFVSIAGILGIIFTDYRLIRAISFLTPFTDTQGANYQLSRSLIAFGRGQMTGVGYGESVQKLAHLPEAHTDFLLAVTGEELGLVGVITVLVLEALIISSTMRISYNALKRRQMRLSYTAFGIGIIFIGQVTVNAGMTMGLLPTKGLTMPLFSYGGSSMLICLIMIGILLNINKKSPNIKTILCRYY